MVVKDPSTVPNGATDRLVQTLERQSNLHTRLAAALAHLDRDVALSIVASYIGLDRLEEIVEFIER